MLKTMYKNSNSKLSFFEFLGISLKKAGSGSEYYGNCPFTEDGTTKNKLYVNGDTGQWKSFTSDKEGNIYTFMRDYYELRRYNTEVKDLASLIDDRKLPAQIFVDKVAFNPLTEKYLLPSYNADGETTNLTSWFPGTIQKSSPGISKILIGLEKIKDLDKTIYITEGFWDTLVLQWLFDSIGMNCISIGVPGAETFKDEWISYFKDRTVYICFDNDKAGFDGQARIATKLRSVVSKIKFLIWPEITRPKWDISDLVKEFYNDKDSKESLRGLHNLITSMLQSDTFHEKNSGVKTKEVPKDIKIPTRKEIEEAFNKHFNLKNNRPLAVMFSTVFANMLEGLPVWLFFIAPPGELKTALLETLSKSRHIVTTTTLTPAALIPGMRSSDDVRDNSILKAVNGKIFVINEFTPILEKDPRERREIFGILRQAYDGYAEKWFASHKKSYETHFGFIAGVTPAIDAYSPALSIMGARFINYRLNKDATIQDEISNIKKAMTNVTKENAMKKELQELVMRFLEKPLPEKMPILTDEQEGQIIAMAMFTACLRAAIVKDPFTQEEQVLPFREAGTRLAMVYKKLSFGFCFYFSKSEISEYILDYIREICVDTCPSITLNIIRIMYESYIETGKEEFQTNQLEKILSVCQMTIIRITRDLELLNILEKISGAPKVASVYRIHSELLSIIKKGNIFNQNMEKKKFFFGKTQKNLPKFVKK